MYAANNILVIRQSALGDVANILPFLGLLKQHYPHARLSCLTGQLTAGMLAEHPSVDQVIVFDRTKKPTLFWPKLVKLNLFRFDLVVDLQSSRHSRWLSLATGAKIRLGRGQQPFYTHPASYDPAGAPASDSFLKILKPLGGMPEGIEPYFPQLDKAVIQAKCLLAKMGVVGSTIAVLNPGHSPEWKTKRWPLAHWIRLANYFIEAGIVPIVTGGPGEADVAGEISRATEMKAIATAGKTGLTELAGVMAMSQVVVSTDSGPMHVAAMAGAPVVALFGPTNPVPSAPYGRQHKILHRELHCSYCFKKKCPYNHECLDQLTPEEVWQQVLSVFTEQQKDPLNDITDG